MSGKKATVEQTSDAKRTVVFADIGRKTIEDPSDVRRNRLMPVFSEQFAICPVFGTVPHEGPEPYDGIVGFQDPGVEKRPASRE